MSTTDDFPPDENPRYFPVGVFADGTSDSGSFRARWYTEQLRALKEPSLSENPSGVESVYRFTWLRSFHHPIAVRVTVHANGTGTLTAKMADGAGGYKPGKLIANSTRNIGVKEARQLLSLIDAMSFWQMPSRPTPTSGVGLDGAQWIVEASSHGEYHVIDRWSPKNGPLREFGLYMACKLGRLDVPTATIY